MKDKIRTRSGLLFGTVAIPLLVGGVSALLTNDAMKQFHFMNKPALSPPGWIFPVVWTLLYVLMGTASYFVLISDAQKSSKRNAMLSYALMLVFNFCWTLLFFNASEYLMAFVWLCVLWVLSIVTVFLFRKTDKTAALLMIPNAVWVTFAGYLILAIFILSRTPAIMHK